MNQANDSKHNPKVVSIGTSKQSSQPHLGELLGKVQTIASRHLHALTASLFDNLDDALFDLAEKASNNAVQVAYFDGMRELRKKRNIIERLFNQDIADRLMDLAAGKVRDRRNPLENGGEQQELSLIDDSQLEEALAVSSMASKAEMRFARHLFALNERLSVLCGGVRIEGSALGPMDPAALAHAFQLALRELVSDVQIKLIVYKLFDRYVLGNIDGMYDEINATLASAGVLPQVRNPVATAMHRRAARSNHPSNHPGNREAAFATAEYSETTQDPADWDATTQREILSTLADLLAARRPHHHPVEPIENSDNLNNPGHSVSPPPGPTQILSALTLLQAEVAKMSSLTRSTDRESDDVQHLKQELLNQVAQISGQSRIRISADEEDTIDLVAMLFEYILQDRNLPAEMQALLARLQIPYLKVAVLDRRLFASRAHPARRLLDLLADAGKGWTREADPDQRMLKEVRHVVETILAEFDDDLNVFSRQHEQFTAKLQSFWKRANLSERRAAEAAKGREKLDIARRQAANEVLSRMRDHTPPALIHSLLTRPWANYLVLLLLRQGEQSAEYKSSIRFIDDLIWSVEPKPTVASQDKLRALLPDLEKTLRRGLSTVAFHEPDMNRLLVDLNTIYAPLLGEQPAPRRTLSDDGPLPASKQTDIDTRDQDVVDIVQKFESVPSVTQSMEDGKPDPNEVILDTAQLEIIRILKQGSWFDFVDAQGQHERAKLSWISPISGRYLFVNRRGLKVADKSAAELANLILSGHALVLEEVPLFDRALDAIVERLRTAKSATDHTDPTTGI